MTTNAKENNAKPGRAELPRVVEGSQGLVVTRIGKSFRKRPVVRSVSLSLKRGEVVGLLGPNGAGKTTCFYMISGLIPADAGTIEVDGHDVTHLPMYRRSGSVICRRKPRSFAGSRPNRTSAPLPS